MKIAQIIPDETPVVIAKAKAIENTYFIFRKNSEEVTITITDNYTIKSSHKMYDFEMNFLREEYPQFFKQVI